MEDEVPVKEKTCLHILYAWHSHIIVSEDTFIQHARYTIYELWKFEETVVAVRQLRKVKSTGMSNLKTGLGQVITLRHVLANGGYSTL